MVRGRSDAAGGARGRFAGHNAWWWASATVTALAVIGAVILLALPF